MLAADRLGAVMTPRAAALIEARKETLVQIRLRPGKPMQLSCCDGSETLTGEIVDQATLSRLLAALMDHSVYARQSDLDEGFFTLEDGSRVGVCGRMYRDGERLRMAEVGSVCIRLARELTGCADSIMDLIDAPGRLTSTLLISPPGLGKTTLLRDVARQLSERGHTVAIADERHELAACRLGIPTLDVGPRTDVMDGCPRAGAIGRLVRTMAPQIIVADEIGGESDALALADAARCGVAIAASAHGDSLEDLRGRPCLRAILETGAIEAVALLGPRPGAVRSLWRRQRREGGVAWKRE